MTSPVLPQWRLERHSRRLGPDLGIHRPCTRLSIWRTLRRRSGGRADKLPERRRPHYTPHQRWRILEIRKLLVLSAYETAQLFRVSTGTILCWELEAGKEPDKDTIGSLLKPGPPLHRYAEAGSEKFDELG